MLQKEKKNIEMQHLNCNLIPEPNAAINSGQNFRTRYSNKLGTEGVTLIIKFR